jgi:hypothetical protein
MPNFVFGPETPARSNFFTPKKGFFASARPPHCRVHLPRPNKGFWPTFACHSAFPAALQKIGPPHCVCSGVHTLTQPLVALAAQTPHTMKYFRKLCWLFLLMGGIATIAPACSQKSGCPANESLKPQTNKKGQFKSSKKGKQSGLFPKKMSKKMR